MQVTNKLLCLESLRGIAAVSVALFHFNIGSHFNNAFTDNAWLMVDFFFVLSGFVIALNYQNKISNVHELIVFQEKRFFRLYPLHILLLFVFLGIEFSRYFVELKFNVVATTPAFSSSDLPAFIANLFLLQNWTQSTVSYNGASWSISAEFYTYAIFGFVVLLPKVMKAQIHIISVLLITTAGYILFSKGFYADTPTGPLRCIYSFFIGVITFNVYKQFPLRAKIGSSLPSLGILITSIILITVLGADEENKFILLIPFVFSLTILMVLSTSDNTILQRLLSNEKLVYLGTLSYGIYMIWGVVWWIYFQILKFIFKVPTSIELRNTIPEIANVYIADLITISGLFVIVGLSHFSYLYIEKRFNKKRFSLK